MKSKLVKVAKVSEEDEKYMKSFPFYEAFNNKWKRASRNGYIKRRSKIEEFMLYKEHIERR